ncbi:sensor histidine kinase [Alloacidobacterium dinghuense]|uniref:sensor histidine kinase n=1 Tax=Alloacidobacterium dinghuense TaxID=2763107 RepID=UPI002036BC94|nr:MASE1 domain-containing protein [Alloacidobacterium dinghuense]
MALRIENKRAVWTTATEIYPISTAVLALSVAVVSYLAAWLGGVLTVPPQQASALWPGCALLVSMLLLVPRRIWAVLVPAGLAGFVLYDLSVGFPPSTSALFILADAVEIVIIMVGLGYSFDGVPRLNTLKALAKYSLFAILIGPLIGTFVGAFAIPGFFLTNWRIFFFSEAIAFLTLTPAVLSWASPRSAHAHSSVESRLEVAALMIALTFVGYIIFFAHWRTIPPALLYSLVPFLLWAALRFGSQGVSISIVVIAFFSIWGAVHGRGPFTGSNPLHAILSLQLFLVFAAAPFTLLAVVVEEREQARLVERELSKRLISEQERERSRIASELHDDICQRLALLSMEIQSASRDENHLATATKQPLDEIRRHCSEIAGDVRLLSHELHSAKLDYLGISAAIRGFCREFGKQQEVSVEFTARNVPKSVSRDGSLCLFRVTQEALHNAVKYSRTKRFWVELSGAGNEVRLEVKDAGIGFDVKEANRIGGLGLVSMQERVRAVSGRFYIESKPGAGTKIIASVPVADGSSAGKASSDDAASEAGADEPSSKRA